VLLPGVGDGYRRVPPSGPLSASALTRATALPQPVMSSYLDRVTMRSAAERVWRSDDDGFVTDVVVTVGNAADAALLVRTAEQTLPGDATRMFDVTGVAGARGFVQTSDVAGRTMFCVVAFLAVDARAFVVTRCTPYPQDTVSVTALARAQAARARSGV
jgi:hypothetical protein